MARYVSHRAKLQTDFAAFTMEPMDPVDSFPELYSLALDHFSNW